MNDRLTPPGSAEPISRESLEFERLLAELSARLINVPAAQTDAAIIDALRNIVEMLGVDRCQLIRFLAGGVETVVTHWWAANGVPPVTWKYLGDAFPWAFRRLRGDLPVVASRIDDLPPEAAVDKATFQRMGVKSNLSMPMVVAGKVVGVISFGSHRHERAWAEDLVTRVRVLATIFGNALAHKRAQEELDSAVRFEQVVSNILAALLTAERSEQDRVIEAGLREMGQAVAAERVTLWQRVEDRTAFVKTHRWLAEGLSVPPESVSAVTTPWISRQLSDGSIVRFARHADLPSEAAADLPGLRALDIRAAVMVPLTVSDAVVGALAFAHTREDHEWPDSLIPRAMLLGEVLAGMLARQEAERREQEAQAQAAHAARVGTMGVFAASLVHELTQPIAASLANAEIAAELLAAPSPDLDELRATVADLVADDRRAGDLIQQLRRFLRRGESQRTELDLRDAIDEVLRIVAGDAAEKGISLDVELAEALPKFVGDGVQIEQVILNLLLNGFDAVAAQAPDSRRVALRARSSDAGMTIEVTDSGPGIDEPTLARIFQPFFTTKPRGMGLGLSIGRSIVTAHGGKLSVQSAPGAGTTFRIELPLRPGPDAPRAPQLIAPAARTGTVFIIDDDPSMRRALDRQLQHEGFRVETFESAQAFLDRAPEAGVACIVSDVRMPGLSGLDLQASLTEAGRELPIVFMSGHGDIPTTVHAMKAGAVSFLPKPFTRPELLAAIGEGLARSRARDIARRESADLQARYESLTPREREVFGLVSKGLLNKIVADRLGAAESTVKIHRGRVMQKMGVASVADLVRISERLGLPAAPVRSPI